MVDAYRLPATLGSADIAMAVLAAVEEAVGAGDGASRTREPGGSRKCNRASEDATRSHRDFQKLQVR